MTRKRLGIYLLTGALMMVLLAAVVVGGEENPGLAFRLGQETIYPWTGESGESYLFVPCGGRLEELYLAGEKPWQIGSLRLSPGGSCQELEWNRPYPMAEGGSLTFLPSENLPSLFLSTASGSMDYIHRDKDNQEGGRLRLYDSQGQLSCAGEFELLKGRGNSYDYLEKKPYNFTLPQEQDLLGMGKARRWILLSGGVDPTQVKNKMVYDLADQIGLPYSPQSRWVELYLNGEYAGLYLLTERNEVHPSRVDIPTASSFLVSKEQDYGLETGDSPYFVTEAGVHLRQRYNGLTQTGMEGILQQVENAILSPEGVDPVSGRHYSQLIDLDSWVKKYIVEEFFDGIDAGVASQYFFYDGEKVYAGPVWDYDDTMGAGIWLGGDQMLEQVPEIFYAHRSKQTPWYHGLYQKPEFRQLVGDTYRQLLPQLKAMLDQSLPGYVRETETGRMRDQIRWNGEDVSWKIGEMTQYLLERMAFLEQAWQKDSPYLEIHVDYCHPELACNYAIFDYALLPGQCLPELAQVPGYDWYVAETGSPFQPDQPIYEEMTLHLVKNAENP